jgi:hypothetical protein
MYLRIVVVKAVSLVCSLYIPWVCAKLKLMKKLVKNTLKLWHWRVLKIREDEDGGVRGAALGEKTECICFKVEGRFGWGGVKNVEGVRVWGKTGWKK